MLRKTASRQRDWKDRMARRNAPSSGATQGVSSLQKAQPGWQGRQSLDEPSSALGPLSPDAPFLPVPEEKPQESLRTRAPLSGSKCYIWLASLWYDQPKGSFSRFIKTCLSLSSPKRV